MSETITKTKEFARDELVKLLRRDGSTLIQRAFRPDPDLTSLIKHSVWTNTFRGFHNLARQPSVIFREWSAAQLSSKLFASLAAKDQKHYDDFIDQLADQLMQHWQSEGKKPLAFGPSRKLLNLLFKNVIRWSEISDSNRDRLISLLHVPLDEYSLVAIRKIASTGELGPALVIPSKPRMGSIKSSKEYAQIQEIMRKLASLAGVPTITIDLVAWNIAHAHF